MGLAQRARVRRRLGESAEMELHDLSVGGARLVGDLRTLLDEPLTVAIALGDEQVEVAALVVRVDDRGCGVRFEPLTRAVESRISRFLTDEQRRRGRPRG